ncbi:MAG: hypothetical protein JXQ71_12160 [Verrucomicrobia bacterium]|nr:hypothetical protein [Verrucomicrobiota bacterium]
MAAVVALGWCGYAWHGLARIHQARQHARQALQDARAARENRLEAARQAHDARMTQLRQEAEQHLSEEAAAARSRWTHAGILSGNAARARHEAEWDRRVRHDPALAVTPLERMLVEVERVGRDPALAARDALLRVIERVAPPGSTNNLVPVQGKFVVELAFKMSALSPLERGARTRHTSVAALKRETVLMCAHVMRELFDTCGWRGIKKLQISCNHATQHRPARALPGVPPPAPVIDWQVLYRCSLSEDVAVRIPSWRLLPLHKVEQLMTVELDGFAHLTLTPVAPAETPPRDPAGPLRF